MFLKYDLWFFCAGIIYAIIRKSNLLFLTDEVEFLGTLLIIPLIVIAKFKNGAVLVVSGVVWVVRKPISEYCVILCRLPDELSLH